MRMRSPLFSGLAAVTVLAAFGLGCHGGQTPGGVLQSPSEQLPTSDGVEPTPAPAPGQTPERVEPKPPQLVVHTGFAAAPGAPATRALVVLEGPPRLTQWIDTHGDAVFPGDHSGPKTVTLGYAVQGTGPDGKPKTRYRFTTLVDVPGDELWFGRNAQSVPDATEQGTLAGTVTSTSANDLIVTVAAVSRKFAGMVAADDSHAFSMPVFGYGSGATDLFAQERHPFDGIKRIGMVKDVPVAGAGQVTQQNVVLSHAVDQPLTLEKIENAELFQNIQAGDKRVNAYAYFTMHGRDLFRQDAHAVPPIAFKRPDYTAPFDQVGLRFLVYIGQTWLPTGISLGEFVVDRGPSVSLSLLKPATLVAPTLGNYAQPPIVQANPLQVTWSGDERASYAEVIVLDHQPSEYLGEPGFHWNVVVPASRRSLELPPLPPEIYGAPTLAPRDWIFALKTGVYENWPTGFELWTREDTGEPGTQRVTVKDGFFAVR